MGNTPHGYHGGGDDRRIVRLRIRAGKVSDQDSYLTVLADMINDSPETSFDVEVDLADVDQLPTDFATERVVNNTVPELLRRLDEAQASKPVEVAATSQTAMVHKTNTDDVPPLPKGWRTWTFVKWVRRWSPGGWKVTCDGATLVANVAKAAEQVSKLIPPG